MHYYSSHGPAMMQDVGATLVLIERIRRRAPRRAGPPRPRPPARACSRAATTLQRFADAVEQDPAARQRLEHGVERFGRTLNILLGQDTGCAT